jgi:hypothetical protein
MWTCTSRGIPGCATGLSRTQCARPHDADRRCFTESPPGRRAEWRAGWSEAEGRSWESASRWARQFAGHPGYPTAPWVRDPAATSCGKHRNHPAYRAWALSEGTPSVRIAADQSPRRSTLPGGRGRLHIGVASPARSDRCSRLTRWRGRAIVSGQPILNRDARSTFQGAVAARRGPPFAAPVQRCPDYTEVIAKVGVREFGVRQHIRISTAA